MRDYIVQLIEAGISLDPINTSSVDEWIDNSVKTVKSLTSETNPKIYLKYTQLVKEMDRKCIFSSDQRISRCLNYLYGLL